MRDDTARVRARERALWHFVCPGACVCILRVYMRAWACVSARAHFRERLHFVRVCTRTRLSSRARSAAAVAAGGRNTSNPDLSTLRHDRSRSRRRGGGGVHS